MHCLKFRFQKKEAGNIFYKNLTIQFETEISGKARAGTWSDV